MKTHDLVQGTPQWHAHRATHFNASDAAAMMGCSPYKTRTQLLHEMHTGLTPEIDAATQRRFDDGHRFEALARPLAEAIIGEELYPVVGSVDEYSASFDGLTMDESIAFEHKTLNAELTTCFDDMLTVAPSHREETSGRLLPPHYRVQMEQQCMVAKCSRILFMATSWYKEQLIEERHCWYYADADLRAEIGQGWVQFKKDLAAYKPEAAPAKVIGQTLETLPALRIEVTGMVTASNLEMFRDHALAVFGGINRELVTDQDFATAKTTVKWCGDVESRLAAAKQHALSQTESIDALFRTIETISAEARKVRLELDKLVTRREGEVKVEMISKAQAEYDKHEMTLRNETGGPWIVLARLSFAEAIKGKRNLALMQDAIDTTLANAKIAADASARKIRANLECIKTAGHEFLFPDRLALIGHPLEHLQLLVKSRIAEHQAAEAAKEEATRVRIRAEEQAKAEADARAKLADEQAKAALAERDRIAEEAAKVERIMTAPDVAPTFLRTIVVEAQKPAQIIPKNIPKATRPTDDAIIGALALNFRVHESKVIEWLLAMDLQTASDRLMAEF